MSNALLKKTELTDKELKSFGKRVTIFRQGGRKYNVAYNEATAYAEKLRGKGQRGQIYSTFRTDDLWHRGVQHWISPYGDYAVVII